MTTDQPAQGEEGRAALLRLRDWLRVATGPSREIDGRLLCAVYDHYFIMWDGAGAVIRRPGAASGIGHIPAADIRNFTASIDAAVTLVPDGWSRLVATSPAASVVCLSAKGLGEVDGQCWTPTSRAPTEPLALCLARIEYEIGRTHD